MGTGGRYALYHFKKTLVRFAVMLIYELVTINYGIHSEWDYSGKVTHSFNLTLFGVNFILLSIIAVILEFAPFKNRRNLDSWFSFPISRTGLATVHALNGAVQVWAVHTISFIWGFVKVMPYSDECKKPGMVHQLRMQAQLRRDVEDVLPRTPYGPYPLRIHDVPVHPGQ